MRLETMLELIKPVNREAYVDSMAHWDSIAKPLGSLGLLEDLTAQIAAIQGGAHIDIAKKCVLVFCADNGVTVHGVAQSGSEVTTAIAHNLVKGKASVCVMADSCKADVFPVDIGMQDTVVGLIPKKLMRGTNDIAKGPAMSRETALAAFETGAALAQEKKAAGYRLIATGEAGIGNTTTASAVAAVLLKKPVQEVTGRGAGLSDEGLARKRRIIEQAIKINQPDANDPIDVLTKVGGLDIAAMAGCFLGGAIHGVPIVMDGVISAVAALCAVRLDARVRDYILPSHISAEPAGRMLCDALGLEPAIHAQMRLGEGTGAVALFPLLDMAAAVYNHAATFADIAVEAYTRKC